MPEPTNNGLRKLQTMGFGELLDAVFSLYRAHFRSLLGIASGYFIVMLIGVSIFFLDDSLGRGAKIIIWVKVSVIFQKMYGGWSSGGFLQREQGCASLTR